MNLFCKVAGNHCVRVNLVNEDASRPVVAFSCRDARHRKTSRKQENGQVHRRRREAVTGERLRCTDAPRNTENFGDKTDPHWSTSKKDGRGRSWGTKRAWKEAKGPCVGSRRGWHRTGLAASSGFLVELRSTWMNSARRRGGSSARRWREPRAGSPEAPQLHEGRVFFNSDSFFPPLLATDTAAIHERKTQMGAVVASFRGTGSQVHAHFWIQPHRDPPQNR